MRFNPTSPHPTACASRSAATTSISSSPPPLASRCKPPAHPSKIPIEGAFYIGIGVCSHDKNVIEKAVFSNVELTPPAPPAPPPSLYSTLETVAHRHPPTAPSSTFLPATSKRPTGPATAHTSSSTARAASAPARRGGTPVLIDTGTAIRCNNDHGSRPIKSGWPSATSRRPTPLHHLHCSHRRRHASTRHAELALLLARLVARRQDSRLTPRSATATSTSTPSPPPEARRRDSPPPKASTTAPSIHPTASTSTSTPSAPAACRSGACWPTAAQEQITFDEFNNWFPHISPDGKWMAFLSYGPEVTGHQANKDVQIRLMALSDRKISSSPNSSAGKALSMFPPGRPTAPRWLSSVINSYPPKRLQPNRSNSMRIGVFTPLLSRLPLAAVLDKVKSLGTSLRSS